MRSRRRRRRSRCSRRRRPSRRPRCRSSARADADHRPLALLIADRLRRVAGAMRVAAARDVDARTDEHVALDVHETEEATRADVDVVVQRAPALERMVPKLTTAVGAQCAMATDRNARRRYWPGSPGISDSACVDPSRARSRPRTAVGRKMKPTRARQRQRRRRAARLSRPHAWGALRRPTIPSVVLVPNGEDVDQRLATASRARIVRLRGQDEEILADGIEVEAPESPCLRPRWSTGAVLMPYVCRGR